MNQRLLSWIILVALMLTWGSSFILIKRGLVYFTPTEVGALRVAITFLALLPLALKRLAKLNRRDVLLLGLSGIVGNFFPAFLFAKAQTGIDSATAGMLNSLTPLFTVILGYLLFKLKVRWFNVAGVFIALSGALGLLRVSGGHAFNFNIQYASYVILATIFYAFNVNLIKARLSHIDAITITAITFFIAGMPALIILFGFTPIVTQLSSDPAAFKGLGFIAILAVVGTGLAMIAFNKLIKMTSAVFASTVTYMIPIVALLWGVIDGEHFDPLYFLWVSMIIGGVILVNRKGKVKRVGMENSAV